MEFEARFEHRLALAQRQAGEVAAFQLEQVEDVDEDLDPGQAGQPRVADPEAPLQLLEAGAGALEGDDLPVGDELLRRLGLEGLGQLRVAVHPPAGARGDASPRFGAAADGGADAVELALEDPGRVAERVRRELCLHRLAFDGHGESVPRGARARRAMLAPWET